MEPYYVSFFQEKNENEEVIPNYMSPIYPIRQGEDKDQISQDENTVEQSEQHLSGGDGGTSNTTQDNMKLNKPDLLRYACRKKQTQPLNIFYLVKLRAWTQIP